MPVVTLSSKGQLVIPRQLRQQMRLESGSKLNVERDGTALILKPIEPAAAGWVRWRGRLTGHQLTAGLADEHAAEIARDRKSRR